MLSLSIYQHNKKEKAKEVFNKQKRQLKPNFSILSFIEIKSQTLFFNWSLPANVSRPPPLIYLHKKKQDYDLESILFRSADIFTLVSLLHLQGKIILLNDNLAERLCFSFLNLLSVFLTRKETPSSSRLWVTEAYWSPETQ